MIDCDGHVKLIDFGFAKRLNSKDAFTYTNCGTIGYAAPEVISGKAGYSYPVDIWSFGILLAELLIG
jgi:serine/threonine protein kinase